MKVKRARSYDSSLRRSRSAELRAGIVAAAKKLFSKHGIDRVTIEQLAAEAGVSVATVYSAFGSKSGILKAIVQKTFFGEQYAALAKQIETTSDPIELLKITAKISRVIYDNEKAEMGLLRGSSAFSPELRRVEKELEDVRYRLQEARANLLVATYPAARTLGIEKVRDTMWLLTGRDVYRMLVLERGWSSDAYETWVASTLIQVLTMQR